MCTFRCLNISKCRWQALNKIYRVANDEIKYARQRIRDTPTASCDTTKSRFFCRFQRWRHSARKTRPRPSRSSGFWKSRYVHLLFMSREMSSNVGNYDNGERDKRIFRAVSKRPPTVMRVTQAETHEAAAAAAWSPLRRGDSN